LFGPQTGGVGDGLFGWGQGWLFGPQTGGQGWFWSQTRGGQGWLFGPQTGGQGWLFGPQTAGPSAKAEEGIKTERTKKTPPIEASRVVNDFFIGVY